MNKQKPTPQNYTVHYAEDIPCYGTLEVRAASDEDALINSCRLAGSARHQIVLQPDWSEAFCKRIVYIEAPGGRVIAENIALDHARVVSALPCSDEPLRLEDVPVYRVEDSCFRLLGFTFSDSPGCERNSHIPVDAADPGAALLLAGFSTHEEAEAFAEGLAAACGDEAGYLLHAVQPDLICVLAEFFTGDPPSLRYADLRRWPEVQAEAGALKNDGTLADNKFMHGDA